MDGSKSARQRQQKNTLLGVCPPPRARRCGEHEGRAGLLRCGRATSLPTLDRPEVGGLGLFATRLRALRGAALEAALAQMHAVATVHATTTSTVEAFLAAFVALHAPVNAVPAMCRAHELLLRFVGG